MVKTCPGIKKKKKVFRIQQHADGMYNLLHAELIETVTALLSHLQDERMTLVSGGQKQRKECGLNVLSPSLQSSVVA